MRGGGAERVLQNLLNQMIITYPHFHIHLILAKKEGVLLSGLNSKIKIIDCNKLHVKSCLFDLIKYFNVQIHFTSNSLKPVFSIKCVS